MKLFFAFVLVVMSMTGHAQTPSDSITCLPNAMLREAARRNEKLIFYQKRDSINSAMLLTYQLIKKNDDSAITAYRKLDDNNKVIIAGQSMQISNVTAQRDLSVTRGDMWHDQAKRWKTKTFVVGGIGVGVSVFFFYQWIRSK